MAGTSTWTFLSNHAHVLMCLAAEPGSRLRDVAERVGITERAVQAIVSDLEEGGAITRIREGRRNRYELHDDAHLRHPLEAHCTIRDLLRMAGLKVSRRPTGRAKTRR
jgi:DNA-binding Lrp family transcriptional regulator